MPELPEVETITRRLATVLPGKVLSAVQIFHVKSFQNGGVGNGVERSVGSGVNRSAGNSVLSSPASSLLQSSILAVTRKAKIIRIHLSNQQNLLIHLKMTGQLIFTSASGTRLGGGHPTADWTSQLPSKHTRVLFELRDAENNTHMLYFNDMRIFGWIKQLHNSQVAAEFKNYGPDVNTPEASLEYFVRKLGKTHRSIKQVIMDNSVISGVGNIYACDGLHLAGIHPERPADSLSEAEGARLLRALQSVINLGIELGGATIENYMTVDGFSGKYQEKVRVYGKEKQPCMKCGQSILKIKVAGRGTYFCSGCQV